MNQEQDPQTAIDYNLYPSSARPSGLDVPQAKQQTELSQLRVALHDIFELASRQKSNRDCATDEGLIATALAAVRVIRRAADELKAQLTAHTQALKVAKEALDAAEGLISRANPRAFDNGVIIQDAALVLKIYDQIKQAVAAINNLLK